MRPIIEIYGIPGTGQLNEQSDVKCWAGQCSDQADILKYCPPCIEDINNGQYLNILIPAWPVTPTRRGNSHRIVPGSHYYELLAKTRLYLPPPPPSLCISAFKYNNSQLDIFKACEIVPMSRVRSDETCDPLDMSGPINIDGHGGVTRSDSGSHFLNSVHLKYLPNWSNFTQLEQYLKNN